MTERILLNEEIWDPEDCEYVCGNRKYVTIRDGEVGITYDEMVEETGCDWQEHGEWHTDQDSGASLTFEEFARIADMLGISDAALRTEVTQHRINEFVAMALTALWQIASGVCRWCGRALEAGEMCLSCCPKCGGEADNGFDRSWPFPSPYWCTKCQGD